jgi:hypothetical protein
MATDNRQMTKWQSRQEKLLRATTINSLKPEACMVRARYAAAARDAAYGETLINNQEAALYCARTGSYLATVNNFIFAELAQLPADITGEMADNFARRKLYHPAWVNLSPEILTQLQRLFPCEFVIYAAHELQHDNDTTNGEARHDILELVNLCRLELVCETAELLRRILALIGNYQNLRQSPLANRNAAGIDPEIAAARTTSATIPAIADYFGIETQTADLNSAMLTYIQDLKSYFAAAVKRSQAEYHVQSAFRARQVTLQDIKRVTVSLGRQQFKLAREKTPNIDNATFYDIAELFADESDLTMAITAKQMENTEVRRYSGSVHHTSNSQAGATPPTTEQTSNDIPADATASNLPPAPFALKIRLFK